MSTTIARPEATIPCPIDRCGHRAVFYVATLPAEQARTLRPHLDSHLSAAMDALVEHMARDHAGHTQTCPRSTNENTYCDCDVYSIR